MEDGESRSYFFKKVHILLSHKPCIWLLTNISLFSQELFSSVFMPKQFSHKEKILSHGSGVAKGVQGVAIAPGNKL